MNFFFDENKENMAKFSGHYTWIMTERVREKLGVEFLATECNDMLYLMTLLIGSTTTHIQRFLNTEVDQKELEGLLHDAFQLVTEDGGTC